MNELQLEMFVFHDSSDLNHILQGRRNRSRLNFFTTLTEKWRQGEKERKRKQEGREKKEAGGKETIIYDPVD